MSTESFFGMTDFKRGKYGWAEIAQPNGEKKLYRRATTVAGYLDDLNGLIDWKSAMTAVGVARSKSLQANLSLMDWYTNKQKTKELVAKAFDLGGGSEAADTGTAFHTLIEMHEGGTDPQAGVELPEGFAESLEAYKAFKAEHGITTAGSEVRIVDDANEIAGTADLIYTFDKDLQTPFGVIEAGDGIIADVKTGSVSDLSGMKMGMQLGIYSHGDPYDVPTGERVEWPVEMNQTIGLILKVDLKAGTVTPWWLSLGAAHKYVALAMQVAEARKAGRNLIKQADLSAAASGSTGEKLGAREVGKLITAATTMSELEQIRDQHGDVFTETMAGRWAKKAAEVKPDQPEVDEPVAQEEIRAVMPEPSVEVNKALGAATTVKELQAAWKQFAKVMTDAQKEWAKAQAEKLKAAETEPAGQGKPLTGEVQPGVETVNMNEGDEEPPFGQDDEEEPPFGNDEAPEPYSIEDAQARAAAVGNVGELKELWREFNRALKAGKTTAEALKVITDRSAEL